jgi:hypothetical protein
MCKSKKVSRVIFCMVVFISIATMLIIVFKTILHERRMLVLNDFLYNNYPQVIQAEIQGIEPDYLMANYLKDTLVGLGLDIKLLWLSIFSIIILCMVNLLIYIKGLHSSSDDQSQSKNICDNIAEK